MQPGQSPFRCKGIIYLGTREFFAKQGPDAFDRLVASIADPELRAFFTQPFLSACWYDVLPVATLIELEARSLGLNLVEYLRQRTTFQADRDIRGVYRFLLAVASPNMVAPRLAKLLSQVFDFGTASAVCVGDGRWRYRFTGWPRSLHVWFRTALDIYARHALTLAGANLIRFSMSPLSDAGVQHGVPIGTIDVEIEF